MTRRFEFELEARQRERRPSRVSLSGSLEPPNRGRSVSRTPPFDDSFRKSAQRTEKTLDKFESQHLIYPRKRVDQWRRSIGGARGKRAAWKGKNAGGGSRASHRLQSASSTPRSSTRLSHPRAPAAAHSHSTDMSAKENSEVAVDNAADEKNDEKCDLKGTKRPPEDLTAEVKKSRKEENGGGADPEGEEEDLGEEDDEEEAGDEEDEEEDIGEGDEDELDGDDEEDDEIGAEDEEEEDS